ncbi:thioredoxin family protein [Bacillus dakarensis]|uniref:thioredoxin family protein n=1 Tax=Robertmurraya dakarensis TaxID=1926278 RepID=UPI000980BA15|nr:thioredoxin family protein [Bacillus dakarensis]
MDLLDWFGKGLTLEQYRNGMKVNGDKMDSIYDRFQLNEGEKKELSPLSLSDMKVIVLTEDWCGDAMLNIPILLKIAEEMNMEVRFLLRDSNLELMDQYLTNGTSRSIPIFVFIDSEGQERAVWGPRAEEVQRLVDSLTEQLPPKDSESFGEKQKEMFKTLTKAYQEDVKLWRAVSTSIIKKLI